MYSWFRKIAFIEGCSFLVLLFIAMPLKYLAGIPLATKIVGGIHGFLFCIFLLLAFMVMDKYGKSIKWMFKAFISAVIPFGTFYIDREWKKEELEVNKISA